MIPPPFQYFAPKTLDEALALLDRHGPEAKVLAGGQSLIPLLKLRLASPPYLIDLNRIEGLAYIRENDGFLRIGALTREADLEAADLIRSRYPIIHDTAQVIADPLVRNLATVGGNLAHGDPANDHPATLLALGAQVLARGPQGERTIPLADFFKGVFTTALQPNEILTEIQVPLPPPVSGGAYLKVERKVGDFAIAAVAAFVVLQDGLCQRAGIALTNVGPTPIVATEAQESLRGKPPDEEAIRQAAQLAAQAAQPTSDLRGSAEYKRDLVRVLTVRALHRARERAR